MPYRPFNDDVNTDLTINNDTNVNTHALDAEQSGNAFIDVGNVASFCLITTMPWTRSQAIIQLTHSQHHR